MLHLFVSPSAWAAGRDTGELTLRKSGMNGILSGERDILTWLVGRDAGSLRGHKVRRVRATVSLEIFIRSSRQSARGQTRAQAIYIRALRCRFQEPERNPLDCLVSFGRLKPEIHTSAVKTNNIKSKFY